MENVKVSALREMCDYEMEHDNNAELVLRIGRDAEGTPYKAEVLAGKEPLFDLPIEIETPLTGTPASAPNLEVETVKANVLGWLNLAVREAARLNVEGREAMADMVISEIQNAMGIVRKYVC